MLSNLEKFDENESDVGWWRSIIERCRRNKLSIKQFVVTGTDFSGADAYFMIFDTIAFCGGKTFTRKGYGQLKRSKKQARILWVYDDRSIMEVIKPYPDFYEEICIEHELPQAPKV